MMADRTVHRDTPVAYRLMDANGNQTRLRLARETYDYDVEGGVHSVEMVFIEDRSDG